MTPVLIILLGGIVVWIAALAYRHIWMRADRRGRVPTGFGALLAPAMLAAAWWGGASKEMILAFAVATAGSAIYWIDDAREMSARARVAIAAVTGLAIGAIYFLGADFPLFTLLALLGLAALVHLALVNTFNMQDGADLNLSTFILLTAALLLTYAGGSTDWTKAAAACLAFAAPFAILNHRPRTIYLGDSGSFAFAALFTIMGAAFLTGGAPPPEAAIPAGLPLVDMVFVTAHRIRIRQKFTVRHYFHLYQRLQTCQPGFTYLAPQVISAALALVVAYALQAFGVDRFVSVAIAIAVASLVVFWASHRFFVSSDPGPPPQRQAT